MNTSQGSCRRGTLSAVRPRPSLTLRTAGAAAEASPPTPPLTVRLLAEATGALERAGVVNPRGVAEQLLAQRLGQPRMEMLLEPAPLSEETRTRFLADVALCAGGVPLQYLLGTASFCGREFSVGPGVFIPRPETEVLVEVALGVIASDQRERSNLRDCFVANAPRNDEPIVVIDVGTGCGAIAVTLALERPGLRVLGSDLSSHALSFARRNARRHGVDIRFFQGNLVDFLAPESVDLLVANLPYLDSDAASGWPVELHWEPWLALNGGRLGLEVIRRMLEDARRVIRPDGSLVLEIGEDQAPHLCRIMGLYPGSSGCRKHLPRSGRCLSGKGAGLRISSVEKDLAGRERVVVLRKG